MPNARIKMTDFIFIISNSLSITSNSKIFNTLCFSQKFNRNNVNVILSPVTIQLQIPTWYVIKLIFSIADNLWVYFISFAKFVILVHVWELIFKVGKYCCWFGSTAMSYKIIKQWRQLKWNTWLQSCMNWK